MALQFEKLIKKNSRPRRALPRTDPLKARDRKARGLPKLRTKDTGASVLRKKRSSRKFFRRSPIEENKRRLRKFSARFLTKFQRFKKYCCSRAEARAIFKDLRLRGQSQGLDLRGQGSDVATGSQEAVSP